MFAESKFPFSCLSVLYGTLWHHWHCILAILAILAASCSRMYVVGWFELDMHRVSTASIWITGVIFWCSSLGTFHNTVSWFSNINKAQRFSFCEEEEHRALFLAIQTYVTQKHVNTIKIKITCYLLYIINFFSNNLRCTFQKLLRCTGRTLSRDPDQAPPEPWWSHHHPGKCVWPANLNLKRMIDTFCETWRNEIQEELSIVHHGFDICFYFSMVRSRMLLVPATEFRPDLTGPQSLSLNFSLRRFLMQLCCSCDLGSHFPLNIFESHGGFLWWFSESEKLVMMFLCVVFTCLTSEEDPMSTPFLCPRWPVLPYQPLHWRLGLRTWGDREFFGKNWRWVRGYFIIMDD